MIQGLVFPVQVPKAGGAQCGASHPKGLVLDRTPATPALSGVTVLQPAVQSVLLAAQRLRSATVCVVGALGRPWSEVSSGSSHLHPQHRPHPAARS